MEIPSRKPDQLPSVEGEIPVLKVEWNKPFKLPTISLPQSLLVDRSYIASEEPRMGTFNLEITGFRGRAITGTVVIFANTGTIVDPFIEVASQGPASMRHRVLLQPAGNVSVEYNVVQEKEGGKVQIEATKIPLMISIATNPVSREAGGTVDRVAPRLTHYLVYKGVVYQGKSGEVYWHTTKTAQNEWSTKARQNGFSEVSDASMLFPYNKQVFDDLQIVIGDTPPESE